jgi:hypothetical protein
MPLRGWGQISGDAPLMIADFATHKTFQKQLNNIGTLLLPFCNVIFDAESSGRDWLTAA